MAAERRLVAIMLTDIAGYGTLLAESEERSLEARKRHKSVLAGLIEQYGNLVEIAGDQSTSWFASALDAVRCGLAIHEAVRDDPELGLRIGVDVGDVLFDEQELHGATLGVASRICRMTEPGGMRISETALRQVQGRIEIDVEDLGLVSLRGFPNPVSLFRIVTGHEREAPQEEERRLAAILEADIVAYSRLIATEEDWTIRAIRQRREAGIGRVREHRGRMVDTSGDSLLAEFPSALDAVNAALAMQADIRLLNADVPEERVLRYRVGIHIGDVRGDEGRLYGTGVNTAARLEALAPPGGLCISAGVYEQIRQHVDLPFEDLGEPELKNIPSPVRAYSASLDATAVVARAGSSSRGFLRRLLPRR
jgi:class 3 adenylate cyclase